MLNSFSKYGFLLENMNDVDLVPATNQIINNTDELPVEGDNHIDAVNEQDATEETGENLGNEADMQECVELIYEAGMDAVRAADDCYIMLENTVAKINASIVSIILNESVLQEGVMDRFKKDKPLSGKVDTSNSEPTDKPKDSVNAKFKSADEVSKSKIIAGAGKNLLNTLISALGRLVENVEKFFSVIREKCSVRLIAANALLKNLGSLEALKYTKESYSYSSWDLSAFRIEGLDKMQGSESFVNKLMPIEPFKSMNGFKMQSVLKTMGDNGWTADDFKNKACKELTGVDKFVSVKEVMTSKIKGETKSVSASSLPSPVDMGRRVSACLEDSKSLEVAGNKVISSLKSMIKDAKSIMTKLDNVTPEQKTIMSEYCAKRLTLVQSATSVINTVITIKAGLLVQCGYESVKILKSCR